MILKELIISVFSLVLGAYTNLLKNQDSLSEEKIKLTQNQSLQIIFDLKFLFTLFDLKSASFQSGLSNTDNQLSQRLNGILENYKEVIGLLESVVDPFDYDICTPFIQSNINKCISRSTVRKTHNLFFKFWKSAI